MFLDAREIDGEVKLVCLAAIAQATAVESMLSVTSDPSSRVMTLSTPVGAARSILPLAGLSGATCNVTAALYTNVSGVSLSPIKVPIGIPHQPHLKFFSVGEL